MPDTTDATDIGGSDSARPSAEQLADLGLHIAGAWRHGDRWSVRMESDMDADHDTYFNAGGETLSAALDDALERAAFLRREVTKR